MGLFMVVIYIHGQTDAPTEALCISSVKPIDIKLLNCKDINWLFTQMPEDGWMAASFGIAIFDLRSQFKTVSTIRRSSTHHLLTDGCVLFH